MSGQFAKLISTITGSEKLEACLKISEINEISDVVNMDEKTLENMEKFIRKRCSNIPVNERSKFIDDEMINNPEKFMLAPGLSQRILNKCNKLSTIFQNVPVNETNVIAVSRNLLRNSIEASSKIDGNIVEHFLKKDRFYQFNDRQLCLPAPELAPVLSPILRSPYQGFSLDSRPRQNILISPINNNSTPLSTELVFNSHAGEKITKETHLNPPEIELSPMETNEEFEIVKKKIIPRKSILKKPQKAAIPKRLERSSNNLVQSLAMEFLGKPNVSADETSENVSSSPVGISSTNFFNVSELSIKHEPGVSVNSPVESVVIVKGEPIVDIPQKSLVQITKYRTPFKSKVNPIDYYYNKIVDDASRNFLDCNLVPKVDFDVELNVKGKVDTKPCANFVCYTCVATSKSRTEKRLKFYLTSRGAIINSNILNHLKIHFKPRYDS